MMARTTISILMLLTMLLCGCTSGGQPPVSGGGAPTVPGSGGGAAGANVVTSASGLVVSLKEVITADCANGGVPCLGALVSLENPTPKSLKPVDVGAPSFKIVDVNGKEYGAEKCALLNETDLKSEMMPGAKRDGYLCFKNPSADLKLYFGFNDASGNAAYFQIAQSAVRKLEKKVDVAFGSYKFAGGEYGGYADRGCLMWVNGTVRNTGAMPVRAIVTQPNISLQSFLSNHNGVSIDLAVGESKSFEIGRINRGTDTSIGYTYYYGGGCGSNSINPTGVAMITVSDGLIANSTLASNGKEVSECGFIGNDAFPVYNIPARLPTPCCAGNFCSWGVCKDGLCVECGLPGQPCCAEDACSNPIVGAYHLSCSNGVCVKG